MIKNTKNHKNHHGNITNSSNLLRGIKLFCKSALHQACFELSCVRGLTRARVCCGREPVSLELCRTMQLRPLGFRSCLVYDMCNMPSCQVQICIQTSLPEALRTFSRAAKHEGLGSRDCEQPTTSACFSRYPRRWPLAAQRQPFRSKLLDAAPKP